MDEDDPSLWRSAIDKKSGKTYYYHRNSRNSTWKKPRCLIEMEELQYPNTNSPNFDFTEAVNTINKILGGSMSLDILIKNLDSSDIDTRENAIELLLCCFVPSTMNYLAHNEALINNLINIVIKIDSDRLDSNSTINRNCRRSALKCLWCFSTKVELSFIFQRNQAWTILHKFLPAWSDIESVIIYSYMISLLLCTPVSSIITPSMTDFICKWFDDNYFNKLKVLSKAYPILDLDHLICHPSPNGVSLLDETILYILLNGYILFKQDLSALILLILVDNTLQSQQHATLLLKSCGFDLLHSISIYSYSSSNGISTKVKSIMLDIISSCTYVQEKFFDSFINMGKLLSSMYSSQNNLKLIGLHPYDNINYTNDIIDDKLNGTIFEVELRPKSINCGWKVSAAVIWAMLPNLRIFLAQFYEDDNKKLYSCHNPFVIELDISINVLASIVRYIHSGSLIACFDGLTLLDLILAASKLGVKSLEEQASIMYANKMDEYTAGIALEFSVENSLHTLENLCRSFLSSSTKPIIKYQIRNHSSVSEIVNLRDAIASSIHQVSKVLNESPSLSCSNMMDNINTQELYEVDYAFNAFSDDLKSDSSLEFDYSYGIKKNDKNLIGKSVDILQGTTNRVIEGSKCESKSVNNMNLKSKSNTGLVEFDKNMSMMPQSLPTEKELKLAMITRPRLPNYKLEKPVVITSKNYDRKSDNSSPHASCDIIDADENDGPFIFESNPVRCSSPTNISIRKSEINQSEVRGSLALLKSKARRRSIADVENELTGQLKNLETSADMLDNKSYIFDSNMMDLNDKDGKSNNQINLNSSVKTSSICSRKAGCTCPVCDNSVYSSNIRENKNKNNKDDPSESFQFDESNISDTSNNNITLVECVECGRKFNEQSFSKHVNICVKVFQQKRKVFDSSKTRIFDNNKYSISQINPISSSTTKSKWKIQSNSFRQAMRAARQPYHTTSDVSTISTDPSYVQCPNCLRRFNEVAAERHIPLCKNKPNSMLKKGAGLGIGSGNGRKSVRKNAWD